jgi:hypothetical protein
LPVIPMRLLRIPEPFDHPDFIFEPKLDGLLALAHVRGHRCELASRNGHVFKSWPQLAEELAHSVHYATLDGEICCLEPDGTGNQPRRDTQPRTVSNETVSPRLGGSAWPADGAAQATTSAPLLQLRGIVRAIAEPWEVGCACAALVLGRNGLEHWSDHAQTRRSSNAVVVAARKKVTDPKCVIGELEARSDFSSQQIPCGIDTCCMLTQHTNWILG